MNPSDAPTQPDLTAPDASRADATRGALVAAALDLFGRQGFEATSTRVIASAAGANVAAIGYHFGGKEGLRRACARHCAAAILERVGPVLAAELPGEPGAARAVLRQIVRVMAGFLLSAPEAQPVSAFLLREMAENGPGIDIVYDALVEPVHARVCRLWATATGGDTEAPETRIAVFAFVGQVVYFRIGRPVILRRMGWQALGPDEAAEVVKVVLANLEAVLDAEARR
jgi:AcrR family transcriptional regulator